MSSTKLNLKIALGLFFIILSNLMYGQTENFATQIPSDWSVNTNVTPAPTNNWIWNGSNGYQPTGFTEKGCAVVVPANNKKTADYYLITKQYTVPDKGQLRFFTRQGSSTDYGAKFYVKVSTSDQSIPSFVTIASYDENNLNVTAGQYQEKIVDLQSTTGGIFIPTGRTIYLSFVESITYDSANDLGTRGDSWFIDSVRVVGECAQVTNVQATYPDPNTAVITWAHPSAADFFIDVVPHGAGPGTGTPVHGLTYTWPGLNANTQYDVYIQAVCSTELQSIQAGPFVIKTPTVGFDCTAPIVIPDVTVKGAYVLDANMKDYHNPDGPKYTTQGSSCLPAGVTQNYLLGNSKLFFSYTPTKTGLITITQTITTGATPCNNADTGVFVYDSCAKIGVECLAGLYTNAAGPKQIPNFLVQGGHTYYIVMGNPFGASQTPVNLCFNFKVEGSDCPAPAVTEMNYNHLTTNGVSLSWGNTGNLVNQWQYVVKPAGSGVPTGTDTLFTTTHNNDNTDYVGLLAQGTSYNLYVRSVCGVSPGTPGAWSAAFPFKTQCGPVSLPYYTGFDSANETNPEPCFTSLDLNHDGDRFIYGTYPLTPATQIAKMRLIGAKSKTNDMLVSPSFVLDGSSPKRIRFTYQPYPSGNIGSLDNTGGGPGSNQNVYATFKVKVSITGVGDEAHDFVYEIQPQRTVSLYDDPGYKYIFKEMRIPIPASIVGTANFAIILPDGALQSASQLFIDDVYIENMPGCPAPYLPKVVPGSVTTNSVQLAWTAGYQEDKWEVAIQTRGTGVPTTDGTTVTTNPYTDTTVQPSHRYEYYVRAVCSGTEKSDWAGPVYFDTPCEALPLPFCDSFNDADPNTKKWCWTLNNVDGGSSKWNMGATEPTMNLSGALQADTNFNDWLITPQLTAIPSVPISLTFDYRSYVSPINFTPGLGFQVLVSTTDTNPNSFTQVLPLFIDNNTGYINKEVIIPPVVGSDHFYVAFRVPPTMTSNYSGLQIDNVCVKEAAGCSNPKDLTASNIKANTANLSWTPGYQEQNWEIVVQEEGLGVPTGLGEPITANPYTADKLSAGTKYEYYVKAVCDLASNNKSEWVGPYAFLTQCDAIPTPFKETFDFNSTTEKCWTINNANADTNEWSTDVSWRVISGDQMAGINDGTNGRNDDWLISPTLIVKPNQRLRFKYMTYSQYFTEDIKVRWSGTGTDIASFPDTNILWENSVHTTTGVAGVAVNATQVTLTSNPGVKIGDYIDTDGINTEVYQDDSGARVIGISADGLTITFDKPAYGQCTRANGVTTCVDVPGGKTIAFTHDLLHNPTWKEKVIDLKDLNITTGTKNANFAIQIPFYPTRFIYKGQYTFVDDFIVEDIPACSAPINVTTDAITDTTVKIDWESTGTEKSWEISLQPFGTQAPVGDTKPEYLKSPDKHPWSLTGLIPAYKYQYYIRAVCDGSSKSEWIGPFEFTTKCSTLNACKYTIKLDDVVNVKPIGTIDLIQNGVTVQQLQFPNANIPSNPVPPDPAVYEVFFCNGVAFSVYWNASGTSTTQYCCPTVTITDSSGTVVYTGNVGPKPQQTIYNGYSSCGTTTCARPTNLAASNLSVLSWTKGDSETQWEVAVQPAGNGTIPQSGHVISTTTYTPTVAAGDFVDPYATTYEYFVRAVCQTNSIWSGPFVFVRNDEASTAVMAPVNTGKDCVNAMNVSFISATASPEPTSCTGINGGDVWLDFTATSKIHNIELLNYTPGTYTYTNPWPKVIISLYEVGTDGKLIEKGCSETRSFTAWYSSELEVGKVYKLRLKLNDTALDGFRKFFDVCITTPDLCDFDNINADLEDLHEQQLNQFINANIFPGWNDNSDPALSAIIIWEATNSLPHFPAYSGGQYTQLVGQDSKTYDSTKIVGLYSDFDTSEITQMDYSFANATRQAGGSTIQLYAGKPGGPYTLVTERPATNVGWKLEKGSYMVPNDQPITRFIFRTKNNAIGHLLDLAKFKPNNEITTKLTQDISCASQTSVSVDAIGKGKWEADPNNPAATVIASPNSNATTISGFNTTGPYVFHWKTRYCDKTMTVNYQGIPQKADTASLVPYCIGDTPSQLQAATPPPGFTVMWYNEAAGGIGSTIAPTPTANAVGTTNYYVGLLASNGCEGPRTLVEVVVNPLPTVTVNNPSFISGGTATVTATPGAAGTYSYAWTVPAGVTNPGNVASFSTSVAGTYSVIMTNTVTTCVSESASGTVTMSTRPTVTVNSSAICSGSTATITATPGQSGVFSYVWSVPTGVQDPGNVPSFTTTVAGTYSVIITDTTTNISSESASGTVSINPNPTVTVNSPSVCIGNFATVEATPGFTGDTYSYAWTVPTGASDPGNVASFTTNVAGVYSVIITNTATTCVSPSASGTVTINALPTVSVNSSSICEGASATLVATPGILGTYSYAWTTPSNASNPGNVASFDTTVAGTYSVIITNTATTCVSSSASGTVTVNPLPTVVVNSATICAGTSATLTATPGTAGAYNYTWTVPSGVSNPGNVDSLSTSVGGVYGVVITDTATSCSSSVAVGTVVVNPLPTVTVNSPSVCIGNPATVTATPGTVGTYTYVWTVPAGASNPGNVNSFTTTVPGINVCFIIDQTTNCSSTSASGTVTINPLATPNVTFSYAQSCINASLNPKPVLTSGFTGGGVFSSSTVDVNPTTGEINLATATPGSYQVTYTLDVNLANCTDGGTSSATIDILPGFTPVTSFGYDAKYCANAANAMPVPASGFFPGGTYSSTNGLVINATTGEINVAQSTAGTYTISYTVAPGTNCNSGGSSSFTTIISNHLDYIIDDLCEGHGLFLQVVPNNNAFDINDSNVSYEWKSGTDNTIIGTEPKLNVDEYLNNNPSLAIPLEFTVTVGMNGCTEPKSFYVTDNPCKLIPKGISPNNDGSNDTFDLTGVDIKELIIFNRYGTKVYSFSGNYTNQWNGLTSKGEELPDGTYFYSIKKGNGTTLTGWVYINRQY